MIRSNLYRQYERLGVALIRCMEQLKHSGSDGAGACYHVAEEIDGLMRACAYCEECEALVEGPLSCLHDAADKQDAAAVSDVLEKQVYPIVKGWLTQ